MAKFYIKPKLEEKDGHLFGFNGLEISFTVKSHNMNGNPVLKVFDQWGNYCYIKGSDAYRYSNQYDQYVSSISSLYCFKSRCLEMDRLQAKQIKDYANSHNISIDQAAKALAEYDGNIWKYSPDTIRMAMIPSVWKRERIELYE